jgi:hypothetical protein
VSQWCKTIAVRWLRGNARTASNAVASAPAFSSTPIGARISSHFWTAIRRRS